MSDPVWCQVSEVGVDERACLREGIMKRYIGDGRVIFLCSTCDARLGRSVGMLIEPEISQ